MNNLKSLFQTKEIFKDNPVTSSEDSQTKSSGETYRQWGVKWSGISGGNVGALTPALQSCYAQNIKEQKDDVAQQEENQKKLKAQIAKLEGDRDSKKLNLDSFTKEKQKYQLEIESYRGGN